MRTYSSITSKRVCPDLKTADHAFALYSVEHFLECFFREGDPLPRRECLLLCAPLVDAEIDPRYPVVTAHFKSLNIANYGVSRPCIGRKFFEPIDIIKRDAFARLAILERGF